MITGIFRIAKIDLFYSLNNLSEYDEVQELLESNNIGDDLAADIKHWYDGYNFSGLQVYNPWSVIKCLHAFQNRVNQDNIDMRKEILKSYWFESGSISFIENLCKIPTDEAEVDLLFSFLYMEGYLTPENGTNKFKLPNKDVFIETGQIIKTYYIGTKYFENVTDSIHKILDDYDHDQILTQNFEKIREEGAEVNLTELSEQMIYHASQDLINEIMNFTALQIRSLSSFATEIYLGTDRADIVLIDNRITNKAVILEIKYGCGCNSSEATAALNQIITKGYARQGLSKYTTVLLGVNVDQNKSVKILYKCIRLDCGPEEAEHELSDKT
eukprot:gene1260-2437_t